MQVDVLAAQRLSINSVSFANNKCNSFGFCFEQRAVLDNVVPNTVRMQNFMSELMGQYSKSHGFVEPFFDDNVTTQ